MINYIESYFDYLIYNKNKLIDQIFKSDFFLKKHYNFDKEYSKQYDEEDLNTNYI